MDSTALATVVKSLLLWGATFLMLVMAPGGVPCKSRGYLAFLPGKAGLLSAGAVSGLATGLVVAMWGV